MRRAFPLLASLLALAACTSGGDTAADSAGDSATAGTGASTTGGATGGAAAGTAGGGADSARATAVLRSAAGRDIGTITITESGGGLSVAGHLTGVAPGTHGIHFHMVGQCSPPYESAGAHWNPNGRQHGMENPQGPHFGDLPNITAGADSTAHVAGTTRGGTLRGANGLMDADGAAIIIHAAADDNRTDPSGNSGNRIICGVVSGS